MRALARTGALPDELVGLGAEIVRGGLHDTAALDEGLRGVEYVFHAAADVRMSRSAWAEVHHTNVEGTRVLLDRAGRAGVRRFVFTSSGSTLGKPLHATQGPVITIDETSAYNLGHLGWVYPHTKWLAEELVLAHEGPMETLVTHPTAIFGPWDMRKSLLPLFRAPKQPLGLVTPNGVRTICDVRDVADGHLAAAQQGRAGERYALAGEAMSVRELFTTLAHEVSGHAPRLTLPAPVVHTLGRLLEATGTVLKRDIRFTEEMAMQACLRVVVSSAKAERELGYRSRPAAVSIADTAAWYRAQGLL